MTVPVTNENENGYPGEYKEIEYLDAHFQMKVKGTPSRRIQLMNLGINSRKSR